MWCHVFEGRRTLYDKHHVVGCGRQKGIHWYGVIRRWTISVTISRHPKETTIPCSTTPCTDLLLSGYPVHHDFKHQKHTYTQHNLGKCSACLPSLELTKPTWKQKRNKHNNMRPWMPSSYICNLYLLTIQQGLKKNKYDLGLVLAKRHQLLLLGFFGWTQLFRFAFEPLATRLLPWSAVVRINERNAPQRT